MSRFRLCPLLIFVFMCANLQALDGVVLVHGLCRSSRSMQRMADAMSAAGLVVVNVDYSSRRAKIDALSEDVVGGALADPRLEACERVHVVAHSLGGILVRSYFSRHREARLGRVGMLGPPNQGSEVVDRLKHCPLFRWINGPAGQEMGTDEASVPNSLGPVAFELGVIAGDRSINWINSLMIPGVDDGKVSIARTKVAGMKQHIVLHTAHPFMMMNREAIAAAVRFVKTGTFGPP